MSIVSLFVVILLLCLAWWVIQKLAAAFGLPQQIVVVLNVLLVVLFVLYLLRALGVLGGGTVLSLP